MAELVIGTKIAELVASVLLNKGAQTASKFFHGKFKRGISSLRGFEEGDTCIVLSSLYPTSMDKAIFKPETIEGTEVRGMAVQSPVPVTGIRDSFGLARLAAELVKSEINFELRIDPISAQEKTKNLILFGSPSSNLVAREFYQKYLPPTANFKYDLSYGIMMFEGTSYGANFQSGHLGVALKYRNPWNEKSQILWLAGIGPVGTEAAVFFVTQEFDTDIVPRSIKESPYWIALIEGKTSSDYAYVIESGYRGGKPLV